MAIGLLGTVGLLSHPEPKDMPLADIVSETGFETERRAGGMAAFGVRQENSEVAGKITIDLQSLRGQVADGVEGNSWTVGKSAHILASNHLISLYIFASFAR